MSVELLKECLDVLDATSHGPRLEGSLRDRIARALSQPVGAGEAPIAWMVDFVRSATGEPAREIHYSQAEANRVATILARATPPMIATITPLFAAPTPPAAEDARDRGYGYCPICGAPGKARERRPNGDDVCTNGHKYPSRNAVKKSAMSGDGEGWV